ncbi:NADPH:quinone oxidoreductase family protein [soil metagenome]
MRVVRHGRPSEAIELGDIEVPEPGAGEVRVEVAAASINFGDIARCTGTVNAANAAPPFTLGMDVSGVVEATGEGAEAWLGKRVVGMANQSLGGMADFAICGTVFEAPPELDDVEAAAFTLPFHISHLALHERAAIQPGEHLLVRGGATAVGTAAIQLGVAAGARVLAVAGGPEKAKLCLDLGAERAIDQGAEDLFDAVMEHTDSHGADVIYDPIGGDQTETLWTCGALGGRYLAVGFNDDIESGLTGRPLRKLSMANMSVLGVILAYMDAPLAFRRFGINPFPPDVGRRVHADLLALVASGSIRPMIGRRIALGDVAAALEDHAARRTSGRTVVDLSLS